MPVRACLFPSIFLAFRCCRFSPRPRRIWLSVPSVVFWQLSAAFIYLFIHYTKEAQYNVHINVIEVTKILENTAEIKIIPADTSSADILFYHLHPVIAGTTIVVARGFRGAGAPPPPR